VMAGRAALEDDRRDVAREGRGVAREEKERREGDRYDQHDPP